MKIDSWNPAVQIKVFVDSDGDIGLLDKNEYSIIMSRKGAKQLMEFLQEELKNG